MQLKYLHDQLLNKINPMPHKKSVTKISIDHAYSIQKNFEQRMQRNDLIRDLLYKKIIWMA